MKVSTREARFVVMRVNEALEHDPSTFNDGTWFAPAQGIELDDPDKLPSGIYTGYRIFGGGGDVCEYVLTGHTVSDRLRLVALVSSAPFIVVQTELWRTEKAEFDVWSEFVKGINPARQIKDGKPGRLPKVARYPRFKSIPDTMYRRCRWVSLKEIGDATGTDSRKLLAKYQEAADDRLITGFIRKSSLDTAKPISLTLSVLKSPLIEHYSYWMIDAHLRGYDHVEVIRHIHASDDVELISEEPADPADIFIPAGMAINIMLLHHFGYAPRKCK